MFILRRLMPEGTKENRYTENNTIIGESYTKIDLETNEDSFWAVNEALSGKDAPKDEAIYAFIVSPNSDIKIPLYKKSYYYMMTSDGKSFDNMTYKK